MKFIHNLGIGAKIVLLLSVMGLNGMPVDAETVTREKALTIAQHFFVQHATRGSESSSVRLLWSSESMHNHRTRAVDTPSLYTFVREGGNGFVIVAGDDAVSPILAYSYNDTMLPYEQMPENFKEWLTGIDEEIRLVRSHPALASVKAPAANVGKVVKLLETAVWGQGEPFNAMCPMIGGMHCMTGCIPTAFAIVMQYHQWPDVGVGVVYGDNTNINGTIDTCDLSTHHYAWDKMLVDYRNKEYTKEQRDAVARLMVDLGYAFGVMYSTSATDGNHNKWQLVDNFKYDPCIQKVQDWQLSPEEWIAKIKENINAGLPIPYAAKDGKSQGAHAKHIFVLDGYTDQDYFHFNWGWQGNGNGYYTLTTMNAPGYEFTKSHIAYFDMKPLRPASSVQEGIATDLPSPIYTVEGIRVEHPEKGLYIQNGKKIYIK